MADPGVKTVRGSTHMSKVVHRHTTTLQAHPEHIHIVLTECEIILKLLWWLQHKVPLIPHQIGYCAQGACWDVVLAETVVLIHAILPKKPRGVDGVSAIQEFYIQHWAGDGFQCAVNRVDCIREHGSFVADALAGKQWKKRIEKGNIKLGSMVCHHTDSPNCWEIVSSTAIDQSRHI